jgi:signal transduction histidine kinase
MEPADKRINAKRSFWKEYLIIMAVILVASSGSVLMFNYQIQKNMNPWLMVLTDSSYVFFIGFIVSLITRFISYISFTKPMLEIGQAARKVASGDFTVRIHSQRKDDKKDELEVLIGDFNTMVEELSTIETLKTDFIANVSHEIKTPLAVIKSYATALRKEEIPKEEKQLYIDTILEASQKLSTLVTDVLRLNKLENQEIIQSEPYSLDEQLRCCILALEEKFDEKHLEIDPDLDEVIINSDEALLEIVWNNLLTNAIKFTEPGGTIKVSLKAAEQKVADRKEIGRKVVVSVSDSGSGMSEETCRRIFDRFYQGDTSHSSEGNGLGLSLVKRIVDLIHGEITVDSETGKGTTFTVMLRV